MNVQSDTNRARAHSHRMVEDIANKKQAIFESTLALIKDHGFHGAPMSMVAKNAGVAAGTIYHYFESKERLICELYDYSKKLITAVIKSASTENDGYKEKFFQIWSGLFSFYVDRPNILIFFEQFVNSPYNADKYPHHFRGELYTFFSKGIKEGHLKAVKPEILLVLVHGSITSIAKLHLFGKVPLSKADLKRIAEISWDGISVSE